MESKIAEAIGLEYGPVALILTDDKPDKAMQFREGKWEIPATLHLISSKTNWELSVVSPEFRIPFYLTAKPIMEAPLESLRKRL